MMLLPSYLCSGQNSNVSTAINSLYLIENTVVLCVFRTCRTQLRIPQIPSLALKWISIFDSTYARDISSGMAFLSFMKSFKSEMETPFFECHIFQIYFE
jgi:hypothetical protein